MILNQKTNKGFSEKDHHNQRDRVGGGVAHNRHLRVRFFRYGTECRSGGHTATNAAQ